MGDGSGVCWALKATLPRASQLLQWGGEGQPDPGGGSGAGGGGRGWKEERPQDQRPEASVLLFRLAALPVRGLRASSSDF